MLPMILTTLSAQIAFPCPTQVWTKSPRSLPPCYPLVSLLVFKNLLIPPASLLILSLLRLPRQTAGSRGTGLLGMIRLVVVALRLLFRVVVVVVRTV